MVASPAVFAEKMPILCKNVKAKILKTDSASFAILHLKGCRVDTAKFGHNWILHLNTTPQVDKVVKERSYQIKSDPNPVLEILYFVCMTLLVHKRNHTVRYSPRGNSVEVRGNSVVYRDGTFYSSK